MGPTILPRLLTGGVRGCAACSHPWSACVLKPPILPQWLLAVSANRQWHYLAVSAARGQQLLGTGGVNNSASGVYSSVVGGLRTKYQYRRALPGRSATLPVAITAVFGGADKSQQYCRGCYWAAINNSASGVFNCGRRFAMKPPILPQLPSRASTLPEWQLLCCRRRR
jgi:hypothetical protein